MLVYTCWILSCLWSFKSKLHRLSMGNGAPVSVVRENLSPSRWKATAHKENPIYHFWLPYHQCKHLDAMYPQTCDHPKTWWQEDTNGSVRDLTLSQTPSQLNWCHQALFKSNQSRSWLWEQWWWSHHIWLHPTYTPSILRIQYFRPICEIRKGLSHNRKNLRWLWWPQNNWHHPMVDDTFQVRPHWWLLSI